MNITVNELPPELARAVEESRRVPVPLGISAGLLCLGMGFVCVWNPAGVWELRHAFTTADGQPSDFALTATRICGGVLLFAGIAALAVTALSWM